MPETAIVTASYAGDVERFTLLCETMDRYVTGWTRHLVLVSSRDVDLFRRFAGPRREIVDERDILPSWLHRFPDPTSRFRRDVWLSLRTWPLRGWHVQQFRRMAIAHHIGEDAYVSCDSDIAFVAPYDVGANWRADGALRLYRVDNALDGPQWAGQRDWSANAGRRLGLGDQIGHHDYINTLIGWRRDTVKAMLERIEQVSGRHWAAAIGVDRAFSECLLYGRFTDEVIQRDGHYLDDRAYCRVYWYGPSLDREGVRRFVDEREPWQVAVGMQSFVGMTIPDIRAALEG